MYKVKALNYYIFACTILVASLFTNCNKQPVAAFTTNSNEFIPGETVSLKNKSTNAKSYKWTLPDGQTSTVADIQYYIPTNTPDGPITFKLIAYSKRGNKTSEAVKNVNVNSGHGNVMFWKSYGGNTSITVSKTVPPYTQFYGTINITMNSEPGCGAGGTANFFLPNGEYAYTANASQPAYSWTGNFVVNGGCTKILLHN